MSKNSFRVFEIINLNTQEIYYVANKQQFCKDKNLTSRLLDYTLDGTRNHHKGYKLIGKYEFILSKDGDKNLYENNVKGFIVKVVNSFDKKEELMEKEIYKLRQKNQSLQDNLRINRKINRQTFREQDILENFINKSIELLSKKIEVAPIKIDTDSNKKCDLSCNISNSLLVQLSDLHFGKTVDLPNNKYNFKIAKQRLDKYLLKIKDIIKKYNIDNVHIVFTGDIFTLDTYMDALLTNECNRAESFVEGLDIISDFLNNISKYSNSVRVVGVTGNESRIRTTEYHSNLDMLSSDNFDTLLFKMLSRLFKNISFENNCDKINDVIKIGRFNIAFTHGDKLGKQSFDDILKFKTKMINETNNPIDFVIFGHIHQTLITPLYARSGSLVGADSYSYNGLNIPYNTPSQNLYIIDDENITPIEIKL